VPREGSAVLLEDRGWAVRDQIVLEKREGLFWTGGSPLRKRPQPLRFSGDRSFVLRGGEKVEIAWAENQLEARSGVFTNSKFPSGSGPSGDGDGFVEGKWARFSGIRGGRPAPKIREFNPGET